MSHRGAHQQHPQTRANKTLDNDLLTFDLLVADSSKSKIASCMFYCPSASSLGLSWKAEAKHPIGRPSSRDVPVPGNRRLGRGRRGNG